LPVPTTSFFHYELEDLKRSAALGGTTIKESEIKIGKNVIVVDDSFRRR